MSHRVDSKKTPNSQELVSAKLKKPPRDRRDNINARIPVEIMILAMSYLSARDLATASCVCKLWNECAGSNYLWNPLCAREGFSLLQSEDKKSKKKLLSAKQIYHTGMRNRMEKIKGELTKDLRKNRKAIGSKKAKKFEHLFNKLIRHPLDGEIKREQTYQLLKKWAQEQLSDDEKELLIMADILPQEILLDHACGIYDAKTLQYVIQQEKITALPSEDTNCIALFRTAAQSNDVEVIETLLDFKITSPQVLSEGLLNCISLSKGDPYEIVKLFQDRGVQINTEHLLQAFTEVCNNYVWKGIPVEENTFRTIYLLCNCLATQENNDSSSIQAKTESRIWKRAFEIQDLELIKKLESMEIFKDGPPTELIHQLLKFDIEIQDHSEEAERNDDMSSYRTIPSELAIIQHFLDKGNIAAKPRHFNAALEHGNEEYFDLLLKHSKFTRDRYSGFWAIGGNNPKLVQRLLDLGFSFKLSDFCDALRCYKDIHDNEKNRDAIFSLITKHNTCLDTDLSKEAKEHDKLDLYRLNNAIQKLSKKLKKEKNRSKTKRIQSELKYLKQLKQKFEEAASTRKKPSKEPKKKDKTAFDKSQQAAYEAGLNDLIQRYMDMGIYPQKDTEEVKQLILKEYKDKEHEITAWGKLEVLGKKTPKVVNKQKPAKKKTIDYRNSKTKKGKEKKDSSSSSSSESESSSSSSSDEVPLKHRRHKKK